MNPAFIAVAHHLMHSTCNVRCKASTDRRLNAAPDRWSRWPVYLTGLLLILCSVLKAGPHCGHSPALSHRHPDEQRHPHAGARRGVRLRVSGWEGLLQLLLLL